MTKIGLPVERLTLSPAQLDEAAGYAKKRMGINPSEHSLSPAQLDEAAEYQKRLDVKA